MKNTVCCVILLAIAGIAHAAYASRIVILQSKMDGKYICYDLESRIIYKSSIHKSIYCQYNWIEYTFYGTQYLYLTLVADPSQYVTHEKTGNRLSFSSSTYAADWIPIHHPSAPNTAEVVSLKTPDGWKWGDDGYAYAVDYIPYGNKKVKNYVRVEAYVHKNDPHKLFTIQPSASPQLPIYITKAYDIDEQ